MSKRVAVIAVALVLVAAVRWTSAAQPAVSTAGALPPDTELGDDVLDRPREAFRSEGRGGRQTYLGLLGDVAFNSPAILGNVARRAGISCNTCHINGATNRKLFIPGLATRSGTFDTTGSLFNPKSDDGVLDALTTPSLRGAFMLAPYGHDGRTPSLREFIRNVIVEEFDGPEPSREIMDALVIYVEDIDFIRNPRIGVGGRLAGSSSPAERRGEALFYRPFPHAPELSCAACHIPSAAFVDHRQHDVGSDGEFKTPTLRNANFNAPYFHDGRYGSYAQVVAHFDRVFYLGLTPQDRQDLVAYLQAVGDGEQASMPDGLEAHLQEITRFSSVLDTAFAEHNATVTALTVDTIDREIRELTECYPERKDSSVSGGVQARAGARGSLKHLVLDLRAIDQYSQSGQFAAATAALGHFRDSLTTVVPVLRQAEPWSLFNREVHDAHFAALRQLRLRAVDPTSAARPHLDAD
jgi:cytochrome c peroxidase